MPSRRPSDRSLIASATQARDSAIAAARRDCAFNRLGIDDEASKHFYRISAPAPYQSHGDVLFGAIRAIADIPLRNKTFMGQSMMSESRDEGNV
jgi:hypothetical protein